MTTFLAEFPGLCVAVRLLRRRRAWLTATASLLLLVAAAAPSATASCGDWLADPSHAMEQQAVSTSTAADGDRPFEVERPAGKPPCSGPFCRQAPEAPAPPVPVTFSLRLEKLTIAVRSAADEPAYCGFDRAPEAGARADRGFPLRVEHPPRV